MAGQHCCNSYVGIHGTIDEHDKKKPLTDCIWDVRGVTYKKEVAKMKRYKIAAIIIIIHGIIEMGGLFSVLPIWLGAEQGAWVPFDPPEPTVVIGGVIWGVLRIIGAVGLLKNLKWGLVLSVFTGAIALVAMFDHMPFGLMDATLGGSALILMLTQYFGKAKATE